MSAERSVSKKPVTYALVEFRINHPIWQGDGEDEKIAVGILKDVFERWLSYTDFQVMEVETK